MTSMELDTPVGSWWSSTIPPETTITMSQEEKNHPGFYLPGYDSQLNSYKSEHPFPISLQSPNSNKNKSVANQNNYNNNNVIPPSSLSDNVVGLMPAQITQTEPVLLSENVDENNTVTPPTFANTGLLTPALNRKYKVIQHVGQGSYGDVYSARLRQTRAGYVNDVAIKMVKLDWVQSIGLDVEMLNEVSILRKCDHPNIIQLIEVDTNIDPNFGVAEIGVVMERGKENLEEALRWMPPYTEKNQRIDWVYQIACGLAYLHKNGIIHMDLKPGNILLDFQNTIKLTDFGISERIDGFKSENFIKVTWPYRPLEIHCNTHHYNTSVDVWSFGIIASQILFDTSIFWPRRVVDEPFFFLTVLQWRGIISKKWYEEYHPDPDKCPFPKNFKMKSLPSQIQYVPIENVIFNNDRQSIKRYQQFYGEDLYMQLLNLIDQCLQYDINKRASMEDVLKHPVFTSYFCKKEQKQKQCAQCPNPIPYYHIPVYSQQVLTNYFHPIFGSLIKDFTQTNILNYAYQIYVRMNIQLSQEQNTALSQFITDVSSVPSQATYISLACKLLQYPYLPDLRDTLCKLSQISIDSMNFNEIFVCYVIDWNFDGPF